MKISTLATIYISMVFLSVSIFFGVKWVSASMELKNTENILRAQQTNSSVVAFLKLFIDDVLMSPNPVSFEERLKIENAVREIKDQEILNQWNKFVQSKTSEDVQREAKTLLQLLVSKIGY